MVNERLKFASKSFPFTRQSCGFDRTLEIDIGVQLHDLEVKLIDLGVGQELVAVSVDHSKKFLDHTNGVIDDP